MYISDIIQYLYSCDVKQGYVLPPCTTYMHDTANDMDRKTSEPQCLLKCDAMNKEASSLESFFRD